MSDAAITIDGLGYYYTPQAWVLRGLDARIAVGTIFAVLGPNGGGKTTLLHLLLGALKPREGRLVARGRMAFVPQLFQLAFDFTVLEIVLMGRARRIGLFSQPSREDEQAAHAALERFGLADVADRPFHALSGGQRQLTIFARAIVAEAEILVLDEPTSALDLKNQSLVLGWIRTLSRRDGLTIVLTTHHPHHAAAVADDAMLLGETGNGRVGPASNILTERHLSDLYGVPIRNAAMDYEGRTIWTLAPCIYFDGPPVGRSSAVVKR